MMSHSYQHPQPQQRRLISQCLNQLHERPESTLSSSQSLHKKPSSPNQSQTSTATSTRCHSFFGPPKLVSSSHQHFEEPQSPPISCCFIALGLGWVQAWMQPSFFHGEFSLHPSSLRSLEKRKLLGSKREVSVLQRMLDEVENFDEILGMLHNRPSGSAISIPNFLPPMKRELLAELIMVEGEIARLECQISLLQAGLKHDQVVTQESKSKLWNLSNSNNHLSTATISNPSPIYRSVHERMVFETKALHFISKAIKGDYNLNDFSLNEKTGFLKNSVELRENNFQEHVKSQDKLPRKSGIVKPSSPMRDPRHPSPKPRERNAEMYLDLPTKSLLGPVLSEGNDLKWQPNKLSESIMKCLNFIYVRLLRTSRAMELEKPGPISKSIHSSSNSRSSRVDTGSNPKSSLMLPRESRQQDPYGIFNAKESIPRDIGPYKSLVIFTSSSMDPKFISSPSSVPLLRKLRVLMSKLQKVDLRSLTDQQKLAFWINMYNACILHGFIQYGVPSTPEKLHALMNKATLNVGGNRINAQAIEHFILRKRTASNMKEVNRNVTFALCCGTRSSPALRIYTGDGVAAELEKSALDYLEASIMVTSTKRIAFPELLFRNTLDLALDTDSLVEWVCNQLPTSGTLRKSMVDCFRGHSNVKASTIVEKIPYDYEFQYLLTT